MQLEDIIDLNILQEIQDSFAEATGCAAIMVDYRGEPLLEYSGFSKFCNKLRENPVFNERCRRSDAHGSLEAVRKEGFCIYRCHAGLVDFAVPVIVDGKYIASMMCGQVLAEENKEINTELMKTSSEIFSNDTEIYELYNNIPVLSFERIKKTAKLLELILKYIVNQYLLSQKNIRLLNEQKEIIELEKQFKDLEIKYYHSQINPHFLFNALNVAGRLAYMENAVKTQEIIYTLADMYRYYLKDTGFLITIEEEIKNVKNYFFIQEMRFGELLKFNFDISQDILQYKIPAMTIQVFVENAVKHGLEPKEELGTVNIKAMKSNEHLLFEIEDNGIGITPEKISLINKNSEADSSIGVGIYNVYKRLEYFFSNDFTLLFESKKHIGTNVFLTIPINIS